MIYL
jgi:hypothetical protein